MERNSITLIMEDLNFRSLQPKLSLIPMSALEVVQQCLDGLQYLHSHSIIHRNIKPDNLIIHSIMPLQVKIIDFGLATNSGCERGICGTLLYCAPEMWREKLHTKVVDIWSLGITILQYRNDDIIQLSGKFLTLEVPQFEEYFRAIKKVLPRSKKPLHRLLRCMLNEDPERRFTAEMCLDSLTEVRKELISREWATARTDKERTNLPQESGTRARNRNIQSLLRDRNRDRAPISSIDPKNKWYLSETRPRRIAKTRLLFY